jgi:hypothetical protein
MTEEEIIKLLKSISVDPSNPPAEIGWSGNALTDEDIKVLSEYLAAKWGIKQRRHDLRQRVLALIRSSDLSASMHPLTETLMRLEWEDADLDAIERELDEHQS